MRLKRFIKSLINFIFGIINAILWIFKVNSLGELIVGVQVGKTKKQRVMYGVCSILQYFSYLCIIGLVLTIYWWYQNETSIAEKLSGLQVEKLKCTIKSKKRKNTTSERKTNGSNNANNNSNKPDEYSNDASSSEVYPQ